MATTDRLVERLAELISFDTRNPDGDERPLVHRLGAELRALGAASVEEVDVGDHAYVYARFGAGDPRLVLNAHVDTVPANEGYTSPPHLLVRRGDRLHGLGTADIKGAIAAILEALAAGPVRGRSACCSRATRSAAATASWRSSTATPRAGWSGRSSASRPAAGSAFATAASRPRPSRWRRRAGIRRASTRC